MTCRAMGGACLICGSDRRIRFLRLLTVTRKTLYPLAMEANMATKTTDRVGIENVNSPGRVVRVDAAKYQAMKAAVLAVLPSKSPGLTVAEIKQRILPRLPDDLFPGGAKAGWWLKGVQLDLEAKKLIVREDTKPLRLRRR
jgi:hypothetical protein